MNKNGYKPFDSYVGSTTLPSGAIPKNSNYPFIVQSSNVQIDEEGHSLYDFIEDYYRNGGNAGEVLTVNAIYDENGRYSAEVAVEEALTEGYTIIIIPDKENLGSPDIYIKNLIPTDRSPDFFDILRAHADDPSRRFAIRPGFLQPEQPYRLVYDGEYWILADFPVTLSELEPDIYPNPDKDLLERTSNDTAGANYYAVNFPAQTKIENGYEFIMIAHKTNTSRGQAIRAYNTTGTNFYVGTGRYKLDAHGSVVGIDTVPIGLIEKNKRYKLRFDDSTSNEQRWILVDYPVRPAPAGGTVDEWTGVGFDYAHTDNHKDLTVTFGVEQQVYTGYRLIIKLTDWAGGNGTVPTLFIPNAYNLKVPVEIKQISSTDSSKYFDYEYILEADKKYRLKYDGTYWILVDYPVVQASGGSPSGNISASISDKVLHLHVRQ